MAQNIPIRSAEIDRYVPQVRPHYKRRAQELFFLISNRPTLRLSPEEVGIYDSIDGSKTVVELERTHASVREPLQRWHDAGIIELIPPLTSPPTPHIVVVEPHMDDAVLSAGGRLLNRRGRCRITILSLIRWSNFTSYMYLKRDFLDVRTITNLRLRESALASRLLGAEHRCMV